MGTIKHIPIDFIVGIILCIIGLLFWYVVGKRRFNRRGIGGLQHFDSFSEALFTRTTERLVRLTGLVSVIIGLLFILTNFPHHEKAHRQPENKTINQPKNDKNGN